MRIIPLRKTSKEILEAASTNYTLQLQLYGLFIEFRFPNYWKKNIFLE